MTNAAFWILISVLMPGPAPQEALVACDDPGVHPWVLEIRDRMLATNPLVLYASGRHGTPTGCRGAVSRLADGHARTLRLDFAHGLWFTLETFPPESAIVTLRAPHGFDDPTEARAALREYTDRSGFSIDWTRPTETTPEAGGEWQTYRDPEPGLNASASFLVSGDTLRGLRLSFAL